MLISNVPGLSQLMPHWLFCLWAYWYLEILQRFPFDTGFLDEPQFGKASYTLKEYQQSDVESMSSAAVWMQHFWCLSQSGTGLKNRIVKHSRYLKCVTMCCQQNCSFVFLEMKIIYNKRPLLTNIVHNARDGWLIAFWIHPTGNVGT